MNSTYQRYFGETESSLSEPDNVNYYPLIGTVLVTVVFVLINSIIKMLVLIMTPYQYKLDMTTRRFCKHIAEIDNSLRYLRGQAGEWHAPASTSITFKTNNANKLLTSALPDKDINTSNNISAASGQTGSSNLVYPNGWLPLIESEKVTAGTVRKAIILGRDLIVTRSADGAVNVLDAYCPHMGVHIGVGGMVSRVAGDSCVQCPFHGWTFRSSDGQCVEIPYQSKSTCASIPRQARLNTWPCAEVDNFVYIWHHVDNEPPSWYLKPAQELEHYKWRLAGRSCHKTNLELRDMHENGADFNHFEGIHNDLFLFGGNIIDIAPFRHLQCFVRHHWRPTWEPVKSDTGRLTHMAKMSLRSWISVFNLRLFDITVTATQVGPARVNLSYDSKWYGKGLLVMNTIPLGGRRVKYIQHIYTEPTLFKFFMSKWVLYGEIRMLERDFIIWNHKKNIRNPIFTPEDKTLKKFRIWHSQFYKRSQPITIQTNNQKDDNNNTSSVSNNDIGSSNKTRAACLNDLVDF